MVKVENDYNLYNARRGRYKGKMYTFSRRDPQTGDLWGEDIPVGKKPVEYGCWVPADSVVLEWDK